MQIKVTYKGETKKIRHPNNFSELHSATVKSFGQIEESAKFFYVDSDFDLISIST